MCGFTGFLGGSAYGNVAMATPLLQRMADTLVTRGPDDSGVWHEALGGVAISLAHRRLSILDLSPAGHQPMACHNGHVPKELIEQPKMGFGVPIDSWLPGSLRPWAEELLSESRLRQEGYFNPVPIRQRWEEHLAGKRNWQHHLWDELTEFLESSFSSVEFLP